jgi:hypothetical protein
MAEPTICIYTIVGKDLDTTKKINADLKYNFDIKMKYELDTIQYSMVTVECNQKQLEYPIFNCKIH